QDAHGQRTGLLGEDSGGERRGGHTLHLFTLTVMLVATHHRRWPRTSRRESPFRRLRLPYGPLARPRPNAPLGHPGPPLRGAGVTPEQEHREGGHAQQHENLVRERSST